MTTEVSRPVVSLRAVEPSDTDCLYIWENTPGIWPFGSTKAPLSRHQIWEYASNYDADPFSAGQLRLIIEVGGDIGDGTGCTSARTPTPCGTVDLYDIDPVNSRAMVGIMVVPPYRHKGIAAEALRLVGEYCRLTLGLGILASEVPADNLPSAQLFTRAGYTLAATRPGWYRRGRSRVDALLFQKEII